MEGRKSAREKMYNLPNSLTLLRICLIPLLFVLLFFPSRAGSLAAALTFAVASLTDLLDGYLARKRGSTTRIGRLLDPVADKLLITIPMVMLIPQGRIPAWMVAFILAREIGVTGLRGMATTQETALSSSLLAKYKTTFQSVSLILLLAHYEYISIDFHKVGLLFFTVAFVITIWSGLDYFYKFYRQSQ